jgi:predicted RNA-binding Zn ribbon-like protein
VTWPTFETGASWLDLLATVGSAYGPAPVERLTGPALLGEWLAERGMAPLAEPTDADLRQARALREALRALALATVHSTPWQAGDVAIVNDVLAGDLPVALLTGKSVRPPATTREALARVARAAAGHLTGPVATALHRCADPVCAAMFIDHGGRRRWCDPDVCGVRNRMRAYRQRQRADS